MTILRLQAVSGDLPKKPFLIRKSVEKLLGVKVSEAYPEKKGISYVIKLRNKKQIETLKSMTQLDDGFAIKIENHPRLNSSKCVISCSESTEYSDAEILEELKDQGITGIRRITRPSREGTDRIPTPTIILTIEGTVIPPNVDFGWIRCRTRPYYPSPMLCFECFEYGHTRARCQKTTPTCGHCSGDHANTPAQPCQENQYCKHCKNDSHPVSSRKCPSYEKENEIQHIMVDSGIGYPAARRAYEQKYNQRSMAAVVVAGHEQRLAELEAKMEAKMNKVMLELGKKDEQINQLLFVVDRQQNEIAEKDRRIAALEAELAKTNKDPSTNLSFRDYKGSKDGRSNATAISSNQSRLELTRKHGTIEDLVAEVDQLRNRNKIQSKVIDSLRQGKNPSPSPTPNDTKKKKKKEKTPFEHPETVVPEASQLPMDLFTTIEKERTSPENLGAKPKPRRHIAKQDSLEIDSKKTRTDDSIMYISDSDEIPNTNPSKPQPNEFFDVSDDGIQEEDMETFP